jgi:putative transposase
MPRGLRRFQHERHYHFITFSCYRRRPKLGTAHARSVFEHSLEQVRISYRIQIFGYVVMPEHVHLLVSEPGDKILATAIQALKQSVSRRLALRSGEAFWQARYYDMNIWSQKKKIEKLRYIHRNPVKRELCDGPQDWRWSSFLHYATGWVGTVEIESAWTKWLRRDGRLLMAGTTPP